MEKLLKEVKRWAVTYGLTAVLIALILGALCYNLGVQPLENQPSPEPSPGPTPQFSSHSLKTFSSYEELLSFLLKNANVRGAYPFFGPLDVSAWLEVLWGSPPVYLAPLRGGVDSTPSVNVHSTTNVQVAGVDEADIVKTDGEYIYVTAGSNVYIMKAYPPDFATVVSKIACENYTCLAGLFISENSNKLAVIGSKYRFFPWKYYYYNFYCVDVKTFIHVYDISNKSSPVLVRNFTMSGSYFNSRMAGEYVYAVISQPVCIIYDTVILPKIYSKDGIREIEVTKIYYSNVSENYYTFTTIVALNMMNEAEEPNTLTLMMGGTSNLYVSLNNIYITFHNLNGQTTIYKIKIENRTMSWEATGTVPGHEINQFSMDEYNNYFRIVTMKWVNGTIQNDLYVLNMNLTIVGNLTNIAPGETLDSARFIGKRCYLTTSVRRIDPFFVIDIENPYEPEILGGLKIPGFTNYLHPYDETHLIGVGRDENNKVQILLFDVSNVSNPITAGNFTVLGEFSDTPVLREHKAFLFDKAKELLVIPVSIYDYSKAFWQGVYIFNTTNCELILRGNITHLEDVVSTWDYAYWIKRALYIEDMLYTVSDKKLKINKMEDLSPKAEIVLP
ncbi:MAG: beta-propeller domain-containing protein [Candidatus Bathyarchaeia archaeon]